jgi:eukaryotic-like serine/threonine-protein kinase
MASPSRSLRPAESDATTELAETACYEFARADGSASDLRPEFLGRSFECYTIDAFLGKGGMAWVFRARHNALQRACAIKILCPRVQQRTLDSLELFLAEARAAASVVHPHIVTVHNIGQIGEYHFIELEYVPGRALQTILDETGQLPPLRATELLLQSCSALAEAHRHGLIHRDFKLSNILVGPEDFAKLADFGLAKRLDDEPGPQTSPSQLAGTPYYMAPELFAGQPAGTTSDVYAAGVSYYYLLTGKLPFPEHSLAQLVRMHREQPPPDPRSCCPDLPAEVVALLERCLAKNPADRPSDGMQL